MSSETHQRLLAVIEALFEEVGVKGAFLKPLIRFLVDKLEQIDEAELRSLLDSIRQTVIPYILAETDDRHS